MKDLTLSIEGMSCGHCLNAVNQTLSALPGVEIKSVQMGRAELRFDESQIGAEELAQAITEAGYTATPFSATGQG